MPSGSHASAAAIDSAGRPVPRSPMKIAPIVAARSPFLSRACAAAHCPPRTDAAMARSVRLGTRRKKVSRVGRQSRSSTTPRSRTSRPNTAFGPVSPARRVSATQNASSFRLASRDRARNADQASAAGPSAQARSNAARARRRLSPAGVSGLSSADRGLVRMAAMSSGRSRPGASNRPHSANVNTSRAASGSSARRACATSSRYRTSFSRTVRG